MHQSPADLGRPIRVLLFCGGPTLDPAVVRFVTWLELQPEIEFVGGFCQTNGQTLTAVIGDRLRRRGWLGIAVLLVDVLRAGARLLTNPQAEMALRKTRARVASRIHAVPDIHAESVLERVRSLDPDLGLIYGSPLLKPQLFGIPRFGTAGIHHGKMPQYRGKKTTFWSMYNGEAAAGVTIQRVNAGIDTGQILRRGEVVIGRKSMVQVKGELEELGLTLYVQAILDLKRGVAQFLSESGPKGKLYRDPTPADFVRFWWRQLNRRRHVAAS
ncbi:MAG TPA: formyltransferase family protein [Gemmatimonadales bacterium]|nr:formyltransferase family protein [Gemmatimonadales bacterium]